MTDTLPSKLTNLYGPDAASPPSLADCRGRDTRGGVERGGVGNTPYEPSRRWEWSIQGNALGKCLPCKRIGEQMG
jgi:hypothetical protein